MPSFVSLAMQHEGRFPHPSGFQESQPSGTRATLHLRCQWCLWGHLAKLGAFLAGIPSWPASSKFRKRNYVISVKEVLKEMVNAGKRHTYLHTATDPMYTQKGSCRRSLTRLNPQNKWTGLCLQSLSYENDTRPHWSKWRWCRSENRCPAKAMWSRSLALPSASRRILTPWIAKWQTASQVFCRRCQPERFPSPPQYVKHTRDQNTNYPLANQERIFSFPWWLWVLTT